MRPVRILLTAMTANVLWSAACSPLFGMGLEADVTSTPGPASATPALMTLETGTAGPFALNLTPFPTATALPTLVLPTPARDVTGTQVWDGLPTYPAESKPGTYFRVSFDPISWALTVDQYGRPVLAHRAVPGCELSPATGRGLPLNAQVEHAVRQIGAVEFQVDTVLEGGSPRFVNYTGGDGSIYTGFEVRGLDQADLCLPSAEVVLGSLRSVAAAEATPASRP